MARSKRDNRTTIFQISFKGIKLSRAQRLAVEQAVRLAALSELAKMDFRYPLELRALESRIGDLEGLEAVGRPLK